MSFSFLATKGQSAAVAAVDVIGAAVPVGIRATSSWARCLIGSTLLLGSHLHELLLLGNKGTVSSGGSTINVVRAAEPVGIRATSSRARCLIRSTLLLGSHLHELLLLGNEGTVSSSGSTVDVVRAAVPVGIGATSSWARGLIGSTLLLGSHLHELLLLGNKGTVSSGGSTIHVIRATVPIGFWTATSRALGLIFSTLF